MNTSFKNLCTRCGTERVVSKTWKEKIGQSIVITTENVCPNNQCQKKVDMENKRQHDKYAALKLRSEQRVVERKAAKDAARAALTK